MDFDARKLLSETRQTRIVFPCDLNDHSTLFGGNVLKWMDEAAYITAIRFCRQDMVTVSANNISFNLPIPAGSILEIIARVTEVGTVKLKVSVSVSVEQSHSDEKKKAIEGSFSFVAIDKDHKLLRLVIPE